MNRLLIQTTPLRETDADYRTYRVQLDNTRITTTVTFEQDVAEDWLYGRKREKEKEIAKEKKKEKENVAVPNDYMLFGFDVKWFSGRGVGEGMKGKCGDMGGGGSDMDSEDDNDDDGSSTDEDFDEPRDADPYTEYDASPRKFVAAAGERPCIITLCRGTECLVYRFDEKYYRIPTNFGRTLFMLANNLFVGRNARKNLHKLEDFLEDGVVEAYGIGPNIDYDPDDHDFNFKGIRNFSKAIDVRDCVGNAPFNFPHVEGKSSVRSIASRIMGKQIDEQRVTQSWSSNADLNERQIQSLTVTSYLSCKIGNSFIGP